MSASKARIPWPPGALLRTDGPYDEPSPAFTKADPPFLRSTASPWNASRNSAYAFAAFSSSSLRFASAASFSFSLFDFRTTPCVKTLRFWSSTSFC